MVLAVLARFLVVNVAVVGCLLGVLYFYARYLLGRSSVHATFRLIWQGEHSKTLRDCLRHLQGLMSVWGGAAVHSFLCDCRC